MPPVVLDDVQALKNFVGREIGVTERLRLTQKRIGQFAEATEDREWIHLDGERVATESPHGATMLTAF
jgi:acyl dehydratase